MPCRDRGAEKAPALVHNPVLHGMSILTESTSISSMPVGGCLVSSFANHALDCPVCDKGRECELQDMVYKYGPRNGRHAEEKISFHEKDYAIKPGHNEELQQVRPVPEVRPGVQGGCRGECAWGHGTGAPIRRRRAF